MNIFKKVKVEKLEDRTKVLAEATENCINKMVAKQVEDYGIPDMDSEEYELLQTSKNIMKMSFDLAIATAQQMDKYSDQLDELVEMNKKLMEQNEELLKRVKEA